MADTWIQLAKSERGLTGYDREKGGSAGFPIWNVMKRGYG